MRRRCDQKSFVSGCKELGLSSDAAALFKKLLLEPGRHFLVYDDIWVDLNPNNFKTGARDVKTVLKHGPGSTGDVTEAPPR